jgi:hypothetical protein
VALTIRNYMNGYGDGTGASVFLVEVMHIDTGLPVRGNGTAMGRGVRPGGNGIGNGFASGHGVHLTMRAPPKGEGTGRGRASHMSGDRE